MYKMSELIGKEAITLSEAVKQGTVFNAFFDTNLTQCKYFTLISYETEEHKWVEFKNVLSFNGDALILRAACDVTDSPDVPLAASPINLKAYNQDGVLLGTIRDIELEAGKVTKFIADSGEINAGTLLSRSDEILVFNDTGRPIKIKKPVAKKTENNAQESAKIIIKEEVKPIQSQEQFTPGPQSNNAKQDNIHKEDAVRGPKIIPPDKTAVYRSPQEEKTGNQKYAFLLGKRLQRSVYGQNGEVIARENELISDSTIYKAKENGKLVTLALHSL